MELGTSTRSSGKSLMGLGQELGGARNVDYDHGTSIRNSSKSFKEFATSTGGLAKCLEQLGASTGSKSEGIYKNLDRSPLVPSLSSIISAFDHGVNGLLIVIRN